MTKNCELCGSPGASKTTWNEVLCDSCYAKKQKVKGNRPAGIG